MHQFIRDFVWLWSKSRLTSSIAHSSGHAPSIFTNICHPSEGWDPEFYKVYHDMMLDSRLRGNDGVCGNDEGARDRRGCAGMTGARGNEEFGWD